MIPIARHQRWLTYAFGCFVILYVGFIYDTSRVPTVIRQLRKADVPVSVMALKAKYTSEPGKDNGAFLYLQAMENLRDLDRPKWAYLPIAGDLKYDYGQELNEEQREALHTYVTTNTEPIRLILEAQSYPFVRFPEERYDMVEMNYLSPARDLARLLHCASLNAVLSDDLKALEQMITAGLDLPDILSEGGIFIDALVACSMRSIGICAMENCLYFACPPRDTIQTWLASLDHEQYTTLYIQRDALKNEMAKYFGFFNFEGPYFDEADSYTLYPLLGITTAEEWTQYNYFSQNKYIQSLQSLIDTAEKNFYDVAAMSKDNYLNDIEWSNPRYFFSSLLLPPYGKAYSSFIRGIAQATTARTALASLLYLNDHGRMPTSLEILTPDYLPAPPRDPFTPDAILLYRLTDTQALFYSVGPNERDDGGKEPEESILEDGDIIFRVPLEATGNVS